MKTVKKFIEDGDRYVFDFSLCTTGKGFAQLDTCQDAHYFGMWANPTKRQVVTYAEGDLTVKNADSDSEFVDEIRAIVIWHEENGLKFKGIDPGFNADLKASFIDLGLNDLLH